jgi:hypothetical protein
MVVEVLQRKRQPRRGARFSLLGDGLLERARSTTFALLGLTTAVGLAVVGVALRESWPLVAGSPIPRAPVVHESVGVADALAARTRRPASGVLPARPKRGSASRPGQSLVAADEPPAPPPAELVSSPAAPVGRRGGNGSLRSPPPKAPAPTPPQTAQSQTPSAAAPTTPPTTSPAPKPPPPQPTPQPTPPEAFASEAPPPPEWNVPPWSNGQGHAYGREGDEEHGHGRCHGD